MPDLYQMISLLPILILLVLSIWRGVKTGIYGGFLITVLLFFLRGSTFMAFLAALFNAFIGTINILMIIFGAVFLYHILEQKGYVDGIKSSLAEIHPDRYFRFFFLTLFLTAFFESVAGFGTPGAIVPLLLISLGFSPGLSIAVVLLIDGFFAVSGAVGTPVIAGLQTPLNLSANSVSQIYLYATLSLLVAGVSVFFFIYKFLRQDEGKAPGKSGWILYLAIMIPFFVLSSFLLELSGLVAAIFMAAVAYIFLFQNKKIPWQPWTPYLFLVLLLLIPKIFPWFSDFLKSYTFQFTNLYGLDVNASLQPFSSPLIPFLLSAAFALYRVRNFRIDLKPVVSKTFTVFLVLFPSLAITQLMLSKSPEFPSMIDALAGMFVAAGDFYPLFSPVIGVLGAFITGSTTVSNIIFGSVQNSTALSLNLNPDIILSLQLAGASLGNAICLFNIIAAAAVAGVENYGEILRKNLLPVLIASLIIAGVGYLLISF